MADRPAPLCPRARLTAIPRRLPLERLTIGVAGGGRKAGAIAGALGGRLISGLITDEAAARFSADPDWGVPLAPGGRHDRATIAPAKPFLDLCLTKRRMGKEADATPSIAAADSCPDMRLDFFLDRFAGSSGRSPTEWANAQISGRGLR